MNDYIYRVERLKLVAELLRLPAMIDNIISNSSSITVYVSTGNSVDPSAVKRTVSRYCSSRKTLVVKVKKSDHLPNDYYSYFNRIGVTNRIDQLAILNLVNEGG